MAKTARELIEEVRKRADEAHCNPSINDHSELYTIAGIAKQALDALDTEQAESKADIDRWVENHAVKHVKCIRLQEKLDAERKEKEKLKGQILVRLKVTRSRLMQKHMGAEEIDEILQALAGQKGAKE